jgi:SAM-dependent methyltransferase
MVAHVCLYRHYALLAKSVMKEFEYLREQLYSDRWPLAVPRGLLCNESSFEEKYARGIGIIDMMIGEELTNRKFLDFGCGEGHSVAAAREFGATMAVGYDPGGFSGSAIPVEQPDLLLTTSQDELKRHAPYDIVLIYDVIDHLQGESIEAFFGRLRELVQSGSKLYFRCHPWRSRHGGHLYQKLNKAFAHLIFTPEEFAELGIFPERAGGLTVGDYRKIFRPEAPIVWPRLAIRHYPQVWKMAIMENLLRSIRKVSNLFGRGRLTGYGDKVQETVRSNAVEPFFLEDEIVSRRIRENFWMGGRSDFFIRRELEISFVDFIVTVA